MYIGKAWRHMLLTALRSNCWQANCSHLGGKELEEDGRRRIVW